MKYLFLLLFLSCGLLVSAQSDINPCGTKQGVSSWLKSFQARSVQEKSSFRNEDLIEVPLSIFIVTKDDGKGGFRYESLVKALCNLNEVYLPTNIQFYIHDEIHTIASSEMFEHSSVLTGGKFMLENNIPNTLNCYVVKDPASNCGYNLPWAGIALGTSCMKPNGLTWAHEIGHALSLPHPFLGWEGGQSHDGSVPPNYNEAAPDFVTYDYTTFKQQLYEDTTIVDTSYVELVDRSNCHIAADGFCDTPSDYLAFRWTCNNEGESNQDQIDPNGVSFKSGGTYIMGYSSATTSENSNCKGAFTEEQTQAMRANLLEEKSSWLNQESHDYDGIYNDIVNLIPTEEELVQYDNVEFSWELDEGQADNYLVQIGLEKTVSLVLFDTVIQQTNVVINNFPNDKVLFWRVRAFDDEEYCSDFSDIHSFKTADLIGTNQINPSFCTLYPTMLSNNEQISIYFENNISNYSYVIRDRNGKKLDSKINNSTSTIPINNLLAGLYFIDITNNQNTQVFKILVY